VWDGNIPLHEWKETHQSDYSDEKGHFINIEKQPVTTWVFEEGTFVPAAKIRENVRLSIVTNYMGTPEAMYDEDGQKSWSCELNSYGKVRNYEGQYKTDCPFRYQGQYEDRETGLYYNRFRYYSPEEGIYISQDPIRLRGGHTLYSYVKDTNGWVDVFGLELVTVYRFDQHSPEEISDSGGFHAKAPDSNVDLYDYAANNTPSQYISTSPSKKAVQNFAADYYDNEGYIYTIEIDDSNGVYVNDVLGSLSPHSEEEELAILNEIPNENIVGCEEA